jgi:ribosomal protein S18 acetylase RimI-like enzyme
MNAVYANGFGDVVPFDTWWPWLTKDAEFDPALVFVVTRSNSAVGICHTWTGAFVKDVVVDPAHRSQGIGAALLTRALEVHAAAGRPSIDLKVDVHNLSAQSVYRRLGFTVVERVER